MAVIIDTEYTTWQGALESGWSAPGQLKEIVQIAAIRVNDEFKEVDSLDLIVRPTVNPKVSDFFVELTGITQERIDEEGYLFDEAFLALLDWVNGEPVICMNADEMVMRQNCDINDLPFAFSSWHRLRPFLEAQGIDLTGLSSGDLHTLTFSPLKGHTHNALHDVRSMAVWLADAKSRGVLASLDDLPTGAPEFDPRSTI